MSMMFNAIKISDKVYWVGAVDWALRDFHGYTTERGTTYNAYLIMADKITLVDTVKIPFKNELLSRISSVTAPEKIDYIISNHTEMDHSGCLPEIIKAVNPEKVFASPMGVKGLNSHFKLDREIIPVKTGDKISLGNMNLMFVETKMIHWPDSMFTYLKEEEILFSQDGFGMHLATGRIFDDEIDESILKYEAEKYFANILMPNSHLILKLLDEVKKLGLPVKLIAPDHGPIWRKDINKILNLYREWAEKKPALKAIVVYDTMWNSTALMASAIGEGLRKSGVEVKLLPMRSNNRSDVATEILSSGALLVGSPTLNNNIFPTIADVLTYLKGLRPKNLIGTAFGSYGWSGESVPQINDILKAMQVDIVGGGIKVNYVPAEEDMKSCFELGENIGETLKKKVAEN